MNSMMCALWVSQEIAYVSSGENIAGMSRINFQFAPQAMNMHLE